MEKKFFGLFHSNISERRARQGTAVLVTGSPHKQKVIEERGRKKAIENTELAAEAKKERNKRKVRLQQRRNLLQERVQNGSRDAEERRAVSHPSSSCSDDDDDVISLVETDDDAQCFVSDKFFSNDKHGEMGSMLKMPKVVPFSLRWRHHHY
jgi:hypothetical protein